MVKVKQKIDREWFEHRLRERELSQRAFAKVVGVDHARVSVLFNGKGSPMTLAEAQLFSDVLKHPVHEILRKAGLSIEDQHRTVKITGYVMSNGAVHNAAKGSEDETEGPASLPTEAFALQVRSHNSATAWLDRWLIFVSGADEPAPLLYGRLALVGLEDGNMWLGQIQKGYKENTINLNIGTHDIGESKKAKWLMRVLWLRPPTDE